MSCLTCDSTLPAERLFCPTCSTPAGGPPVEPGMRTRALRGIGVAAIVGVVAVLVAETITRLFPLVGVAIAEEALRTGDVDLLNRAALLDLVLAVGALAVWIFAGVLVIVWFWRARKNLEAFPGARQGMRAGWAIGGWFLPLANLVIPFRVGDDVARASLWRQKTPWVVSTWWVMFLFVWFGNVWGGHREETAMEALPTVLSTRADFQQYVDYYQAMFVPRLLFLLPLIVSAAALIWMIVTIGRAQEARIARGRTGPLMPGATVPTPPSPR
jgi:hypothetical protein